MNAAGTTAPDSAKRRAVRPWHISLLLVALAILGGTLYAGMRTKAAVRVTNPSYGDIRNEVTTSGTVVPVHDFPARANFTGLVEKIYVHLGQNVRAGQLLIRMKDQYAVSRLDAARAALDSSELNMDNVEHNGSQEERYAFASDLERAQSEQQQAARAYANIQALQKSGSVTQAEVDAAKQRLDTANAGLQALLQRQTRRYSPLDIKSWQDKVAADKASVAAERISYQNANIISPIPGTVYQLPTIAYDFVPAGTDLLHVADLSHIEVRAEFEEPDMAKIRVGQQVNITWEGKPGRTWHGHLSAKPMAVMRSGARSVGKCIITLDDDHGDLPIDTNVQLFVQVENHNHVLIIPHEALRTEGASHYVWRVLDQRLRKTPVQIGLASAMSVEITRGLTPNDVVVVRAADDEKLTDNLRVSTQR